MLTIAMREEGSSLAAAAHEPLVAYEESSERAAARS